MFLNRFKQALRQSAVRQTLALMVVFSTVVSFAWLGTSWFVQRELERLATQRLVALAASVSQSIVDEQALPLPLAGQAFAILENDRIFEGSLPFELPKERLSTGIFQTDSPTDRYVDYLYFVSRFEDQYIVAAEIFERQEELLDALDLGLQLALWISLLSTGAAGLWLGRRAQTRIDVIGHGLSRVAQGELSARIDLQGGHDDLNALSDLINSTTERLDGLVGQMRVQASNIAHDLRTPLARLRAGLETAQMEAEAKGKEVPVDYIEDALVQVDHIIGTFDALLRLARIENSARQEAFEIVSLGSIAKQLVEVFGPVVEDKGHHLNLTISEAQNVEGDFDLLIQMGANLIQNSLRYGAEQQHIRIAVEGCVLSITDQGTGIPFSERQKVLEPLYRISDTRQSDGNGLGLSLVRAICDLHKAELTLTDAPEASGLRVSIRFPQIIKL